MPLFNGADLFGIAVVVSPEPTPPAIQLNTYCGVSGSEKLWMGDRGSVHKLTGEFWGATPYDIGQAYLTIHYLIIQATAGVFYDDTMGLTWPNSYITGFRFTGPTAVTPGWGYTRSYECNIVSLLSP
jgi:hypothetical protein